MKESIWKKLLALNEDERFYQKYYEAKQAGKLEKFLQNAPLEYIKKHRLIIPELTTVEIPVSMPDETFFSADSHKMVLFSPHNRYTPSFFHQHIFFEMLCVMKGQVLQHFHYGTVLLEAGDFCLISPSMEHAIEANGEDCVALNVLIRRHTMQEVFQNILCDHTILSTFFLNSLYKKPYSSYLTFHTRADKEMRDSILAMYQEQLLADEFSDRLLPSMLMTFFTKLVQKHQHHVDFPTYRKADEDTAKIYQYIIDHLANVTLNDLAAHLNYSVPYCSKRIKQKMGVTFRAMLQEIRFRKAERLLVQTHMSVAKISEELGYENPENFMRGFKNYTSMSPSAYRRIHTR